MAVLERGWLAGGNVTRNTTIIRSNYLWDESAAIYEHSLKLWEGLEEELDYDLLFSQRGVLNLAHSLQDVRDLGAARRRQPPERNRRGVARAAQVAELCPILNVSPETRYPVLGATYQARGGIARHENVAWGYARAADALGVDLIQGCEVTGFDGLTLLAGVELPIQSPAAGARVGAVRAGARHAIRAERTTAAGLANIVLMVLAYALIQSAGVLEFVILRHSLRDVPAGRVGVRHDCWTAYRRRD